MSYTFYHFAAKIFSSTKRIALRTLPKSTSMFSIMLRLKTMPKVSPELVLIPAPKKTVGSNTNY